MNITAHLDTSTFCARLSGKKYGFGFCLFCAYSFREGKVLKIMGW